MLEMTLDYPDSDEAGLEYLHWEGYLVMSPPPPLVRVDEYLFGCVGLTEYHGRTYANYYFVRELIPVERENFSRAEVNQGFGWPCLAL